MIPLPQFSGGKVAVLGLGRSGLAAARALAAGGAEVRAWDDDPARRAVADRAGLRLADPAGLDWGTTALLVLSPGIPHRFPAPHPAADAARTAGKEIVCDIELLARARPAARFVGITGTNGKSTTTALIGHILARAGRKVAVGGNIGTPALDLPSLSGDGVYALELSSYQLELMTTPIYDCAVILNISPDHLDRHGGLAGYVAAKARLLDLQRTPATLVIGIDDPHCRALRDRARRDGGARLVPISAVEAAPGGVYALDGRLIDDIDGTARPVFDLAEAPALPGAHNGQNAAAAYAVARGLDIDPETIAAALRDFPGLPHRQETVATAEGVAYVNDSKATNLTAAARALASYDAVYWIAGGRAKGEDPADLAPYFDRIRHAFLIGEAAPDFARALAGHVPATHCGDLATALDRAHGLARKEGRPGAVVLLSPGCASFDQWPDFEARGNAFRAAVRTLLADATEARA